MELEQMLARAMPYNERPATIDTYMSEQGLYSGMPMGPTPITPMFTAPPPAPLLGHQPKGSAFPLGQQYSGIGSSFPTAPTPLIRDSSYESIFPRNQSVQKEPLTIYQLPSGTDVHLHNDCGAGNLKYGNEHLVKFDAYKSAMADFYAQNVGFPKLERSCLKLHDK